MTAREFGTVPAEPIEWVAVRRGDSTGRQEVVDARLWFEARAAAALLFGCEPGELIVRQRRVA